MRGQQHGDAVVLERADHFQKLRGRVRIEAGGRLVEDRDRDVLHQDFGKAEPLAHAARERADPLDADIAETDAVERGDDPLVADARLDADQGRGVAQVVERRHVVVEADGIGQIADQALDLKRLARRIVAEHADAAAGHIGQAEHHQDGRGLARAVRPEQAEDLAASDRERNVVHGGDAAIALGQPLGLDDGVGHRRPNLATAPTMISSAMAMMAMPMAPHMVETPTATRNWVLAVSPRADALKVGA